MGTEEYYEQHFGDNPDESEDVPPYTDEELEELYRANIGILIEELC